jgi:peptide/nickel transport system substrate-binding protein
MRFVRFDDYYQGRPHLDALIVRFASDANTMIANILAGAVDVAFPPTLGLEAQLEVKQRWEGTGNEVIVTPRTNVRYLEPKIRLEFAEPKHGLPNRLVRRALYHALDRPDFSQAVCSGLCPLADSWISPASSLRSEVESAIPQYPYNLAQAGELLDQAGWTRGTDGVLVHRESGERFRLMIFGSPDSDREMAITADAWKALGVESNLHTIPRAQDNNETRSRLPGAGFASTAMKQFYTDRLHSRYTTTAANQWSGGNRSGYSNPRFDAASDRLMATIDPPERVPLHRELLQEGMGDVAIMPTYWLVEAALVLKGVQGIRTRSTWNIFEWDISRSG